MCRRSTRTLTTPRRCARGGCVSVPTNPSRSSALEPCVRTPRSCSRGRKRRVLATEPTGFRYPATRRTGSTGREYPGRMSRSPAGAQQGCHDRREAVEDPHTGSVDDGTLAGSRSDADQEYSAERDREDCARLRRVAGNDGWIRGRLIPEARRFLTPNSPTSERRRGCEELLRRMAWGSMVLFPYSVNSRSNRPTRLSNRSYEGASR